MPCPDARPTPAFLVARCLAPGCRASEAFSLDAVACGQRDLPPQAFGPKLRCRCGSRQVRVEASCEPGERHDPPWLQLWVL